MTMRVRFNGVIEGSVALRDGESEDDAILRAEARLNDLLFREAKRLGRPGEEGPIVGLERVED